MKKLLLILPLFFLSCEKSFNEELPEAPDQLVLNALLSADDSLSVFTLSKTTPYRSLDIPPLISNASLEWKVNGSLSPIAPCDTNAGEPSMRYCDKSILQEGDIIEVKVNYSTHKELVAKTYIPVSPEIRNIYIDSSNATSSNYVLQFDVLNEPGNKEYYMVQVFTGENFFPGYSEEVQLSTKDVTLEMLGVSNELIDLPIDDPVGLKCFFTDEFFTGDSKTIRLSLIYSTSNTSDKLFLNVTSCSPDYYHYQRSKILNQLTSSNPFKTPVQYQSNVENGIGVVAGYSHKAYPLN